MIFSTSSKFSRSSLVKTRFDIGWSKKFHELDYRKLVLAKMISDYFPSIRNLKATEGVRPVDSSVRLKLSERRIMTVSEPEA